jgi:hypothetical protein
MTARFYTVGSFLMRSRNLFVAVGKLMEGRIEAGMTVTVNLGNLKLGTRIESVEVVEVNCLSKDYMGLVFAFEQPADLEVWQALQLSDETLLVESITPGPNDKPLEHPPERWSFSSSRGGSGPPAA